MREIKFRAWDKQYNFMIPAEDIHPRVMNEFITGEGKVLEIDERHSYLGTNIDYLDISENRILMQYTGLKDKNGKEIYEGDILKIHQDRTLPQVVTFNEGFFQTDEFALFELSRNKERQFEVIGNIYENPELIPS